MLLCVRIYITVTTQPVAYEHTQNKTKTTKRDNSASGFLCFGPSVFACIALILSIYANARCHFVDITAWDILDTLPFAPTSLGLWCVTTANGNKYSIADYQFDDKFQAARGLSVTTNALGWIIIVFYLIAGCVRFSPNAFRLVGFFGICASMFQGLVFLVLRSDVCAVGCSLDTGGKCGIAACVMWFLTGLFSCGVGKEAEEDEDKREGNES
jgi:hypothetical protein